MLEMTANVFFESLAACMLVEFLLNRCEHSHVAHQPSCVRPFLGRGSGVARRDDVAVRVWA